MKCLAHWKAHEKGIVDVDWVSERGMIITASNDCCVMLWAPSPHKQGFCLVGLFQDKDTKLWNLSDHSTWVDTEPRTVDPSGKKREKTSPTYLKTDDKESSSA